MTKLFRLKKEIETMLQQSGIEEASLDARLLITDTLDIPSIDFALNGEQEISTSDVARVMKRVSLRQSRIPMSQIFGEKEFWSLSFKVTKDTLTPRPDSETLIENALNQIDDKDENLMVLDMGTGTGCLLLSLLSELPNASGLGIDISEAALAVASENAADLNLSERAAFKISSWTENLDPSLKFDLIISNPPYIGLSEKDDLSPEVRDNEPGTALFSGDEGLDDYRQIADQVSSFLKPGGFVVLEIGYLQAVSVSDIFTKAGFKSIATFQDLGGRDRALIIKK